MPAGSQYEDDDDYESGDESSLVRDLRAQIKDLSKKNGKLESQLGQFVKQQRQSTITAALKAKGLNPNAAKFYPADADVDEDAVAEWISENADVFGAARVAATEDTTDTPGDSGESPAPVVEQAGAVPSFIAPQDRAAYLRMAAAGLTGTASTTRDAELAAGIAQAKTPEELTAFLQSQRG